MDPSPDDKDIDLYAILGVSKSASKDEIRKAYRKQALSSHPDKVPEDQRDAAEVRFKAAQQAYEILFDDQKRSLYDEHGMSAFDGSQMPGGGPGMDMGDLLAEMFGMGGGGRAGGRGGPRKSPDEEQKYECSLQDFYTGKSVKFASTKQVICPTCKGSGGKEKAKPRECSLCSGQGTRTVLQPMGPIIQQSTVKCGNCNGVGRVYEAKDRCKRCKGTRTIEERKQLELYIPPGSKEGDVIRLEGEADQVPDQEPGDIVFHLVETEHEIFRRAGSDLTADLDITLGEALCGFSRVVLKHLDGRGISLTHPHQPGEFLRPGQTLKIAGEGMPIKRKEAKGDLYLTCMIEFPPDGTLGSSTLDTLKQILPEPEFPEIEADVIDEVDYDPEASIDDFGGGDGEWVDADDDAEGMDGPQCRQQ